MLKILITIWLQYVKLSERTENEKFPNVVEVTGDGAQCLRIDGCKHNFVFDQLLSDQVIQVIFFRQ